MADAEAPPPPDTAPEATAGNTQEATLPPQETDDPALFETGNTDLQTTVGYLSRPVLEEHAIKEAFEKFADAGLQELPTNLAADFVKYLGLPVPDNLDKLVLSVSEHGKYISFSAARALCGLIYGKGPIIEASPKQKQVGTRRTYLENGHITEDEAALGFMRALEEHKKKCEREGKYMEARTAAKRLHDLKVRFSVLYLVFLLKERISEKALHSQTVARRAKEEIRNESQA